MDSQKENPSEEDIPSDFFDDFNKEEFIQGLSVIDSWDDDEQSTKKRESVGSRPRINNEAVDSVKDLRELIDARDSPSKSKREDLSEEKKNSENRKRSSSVSRLDSYIQPGSRRDPSKTSEAIRRDKEEKVKEHLAKQLESSDDLRPPGTELDDFFEGPKSMEKKKIIGKTEEKHMRTPHWEPRSPPRKSPTRRSPRRHHERRSPRRSPFRRFSPRRSPHRRSPHRRSPVRRFSPIRSWRFSPQKKFKKFIRYSPPRRDRDRSPNRHYGARRSRSRSLGRQDDFLYPKSYRQTSSYDINFTPSNPYPTQPYAPGPTEYSINAAEYSYPQSQAYAGYPTTYDYGPQPGPQMVPPPQPVPAPSLGPNLNVNPSPSMVPPPQQMVSPVQPQRLLIQVPNPPTPQIDPLAQLVAEGKLSHEDYLKLAPNKGSAPVDTQGKIQVLKRCNQAISELDKLSLPTRLLINNSAIGVEQKSLAPKFCSPLKRQVTVEFHFTKASVSATANQNKQIVDNIIAAVGLDKVIERSKRRSQKNMKEAAVQTSKPFCDVCQIRSSTKYADAGTSTEPEYFSSSVHTQVVEQDLMSSKAVFNPTGSGASNPPMSIAHLTPAQLVSQLAARAKTLKQSPERQFGRNDSPNYDNRGYYHQNYSNYRY